MYFWLGCILCCCLLVGLNFELHCSALDKKSSRGCINRPGREIVGHSAIGQRDAVWEFGLSFAGPG